MLRTYIKNLVANLLYASGLLTLLVRSRYRNRAVVLTYHRVLPRRLRRESFSHDAIIVTPDIFERHLALLKKLFYCLDEAEFAVRMQRRDFTGPAQCLITFDDAWQDNYTYAFEALKRHDLPAVIFVPTDYIGTGALFWQERLGHLVDQICQRMSDRAEDVLAPHGWSHIPGLALDQRTEEIKSVVRSIKSKDYSEIEQIMETLEKTLGGPLTDFGPDTYLSVKQMQEMIPEGISFQSHGCSHRVFTRLDAAELKYELEESARWLDRTLGHRPLALAYPNGDHDANVQRQTAAAGYHLAFTTLSGCVTSDSDPTSLRRINVSDSSAGNEARLLMALLLSS